MKYTGKNGHLYHQVRHEIDDLAQQHIIRRRAKKFQKFIDTSDSVLEYGAGLGWNLKGINAAQKVAFDTAESLANHYDLGDITFVSEEKLLHRKIFDVIICHHVLEHVENPYAFLRNLQKYANESTKIIVCVPSEVQSRYNNGVKAFDKDFHLYTWNLNTLANLLTNTGYKISEITVRRFGYERYIAVLFRNFHFSIYDFFVRLAQLIRPESEIFAIINLTENTLKKNSHED